MTQNPYPPSRVLVSASIPKVTQISTSDIFVDIFDDTERGWIVKNYGLSGDVDCTCIRLDCLNNGVCSLSPVSFYDLICYNIAGFWKKDKFVWDKVCQYTSKYGRMNTFEKVLSVRELPNVIGVSVLIYDENNEYLIVERNRKTAIGAGALACSATGFMSINDIKAKDPFLTCGIHTLKDDLNLICNLEVTGIVMSLSDMYPIVLLRGQVQRKWKFLVPTIKAHSRVAQDINNILIIPKQEMLPIISTFNFTDVASYQIFMETGGSHMNWRRVSQTITPINNYYI